MISVLPVKDKEKADELSAKAGVEPSLAYIEYEFEKEQGYILFGMKPGEGVIRAVCARDDTSFDLLMRAVLSNLFDIGINRIILSEKVDKEAAERLSFVHKGSNVIDPVEDILYHCKNCRKS